MWKKNWNSKCNKQSVLFSNQSKKENNFGHMYKGNEKFEMRTCKFMLQHWHVVMFYDTPLTITVYSGPSLKGHSRKDTPL